MQDYRRMFERMRRRREFPIIISSRSARETYFEYSLRYGSRVLRFPSSVSSFSLLCAGTRA